MKKTLLLASVGVLAVVTSTSSLANTREYRPDGVVRLSVHGNEHNKLAWDSRKRDEHADRDDERDSRRVREQTQRTRQGDGVDQGMQAVPTAAGPGQPGDGWRYYSDPAAGRAVVISPLGAYFLNLGKGLGLVAVTQTRYSEAASGVTE